MTRLAIAVLLLSLSLSACTPAVTGGQATSGQKLSPRQVAVMWTDKSNRAAMEANWSEVIRTASAAIHADPAYPDPYINRSWGYLEKGFADRALADAEKALTLAPNDPRALNNRGLVHMRAGRIEPAKADFGKACSAKQSVACSNYEILAGHHPKERTTYFLGLADRAFASGDWDGVIRFASELIGPKERDPAALTIRAGAYANKGMAKEALRDADEAIRMNPDLGAAYNNKAFALEKAGKAQEAALNYEMACNLDYDLACANLKVLQGRGIQ